MRDTDLTTSGAKAGRGKRKGEPRKRKADQPRSLQPDQPQAAEEPIAATAEPADTAPVETSAPIEVAADTAPSTDTAPADTAPADTEPADTAPMDVPPIEVAAPVDAGPISLQTIANAYGDYTRKSLEETRSFVEKLTGARSLDKAVEVQTEFARHACEIFVAESQKIYGLHKQLARQALDRLEGLATKSSRDPR